MGKKYRSMRKDKAVALTELTFYLGDCQLTSDYINTDLGIL